MIIADRQLTRLLHDLGYYKDMHRIALSLYNHSEFESIVCYLMAYDMELQRVQHYLTIYNLIFLDPARETWYKLKYSNVDN